MRTALPRHVGLIPDGNRRWAQGRGLARQDGYGFGVEPGLRLFEHCCRLGIPELSIYGFTQDNTRRPSVQTQAFRAACVEFGLEVARRGGALLAVGDHRSPLFPEQLRPYCIRRGTGTKVNLLVNYGWDWDLQGLQEERRLRSGEVPRMDLIVRWGGGRRLSGFLPVQAVYADFFVVDAYWPDYDADQFDAAIDWFRRQDRTLGG